MAGVNFRGVVEGGKMRVQVIMLVTDGEGKGEYKCFTGNVDKIFIRADNKKFGYVEITGEDMIMEVMDNETK